MSYRYLEHIGDAAIEATGKSLEQAFSDAARALFAIMVKDKDVVPDKDIQIEVSASTREELLVEFLNELLAQQGLNEIIFTDCSVNRITQSKMGSYVLCGIAAGAKPEKMKGKLGPEVKAASYLGLRVEESSGEFTVRCVLDL